MCEIRKCWCRTLGCLDYPRNNRASYINSIDQYLQVLLLYRKSSIAYPLSDFLMWKKLKHEVQAKNLGYSACKEQVRWQILWSTFADTFFNRLRCNIQGYTIGMATIFNKFKGSIECRRLIKPCRLQVSRNKILSSRRGTSFFATGSYGEETLNEIRCSKYKEKIKKNYKEKISTGKKALSPEMFRPATGKSMVE